MLKGALGKALAAATSGGDSSIYRVVDARCNSSRDTLFASS